MEVDKFETEMSILEIRALHQQIRLVEKPREVDRLKAKLKTLQTENLSGGPAANRPEKVMLGDLQNMEHLEKEAEESMVKHGKSVSNSGK